MSTGPFSRATVRAIKQYAVFYSVDIANAFEDNGLERGQVDPTQGTIFSSVIDSYFNGVDFSNPSDLNKFLDALSTMLLQKVGWSHTDILSAQEDVEEILKLLRKDGYQLVNDHLIPLNAPGIDVLGRIASDTSAQQLRILIARMTESVERDPALAIGASKELVESVCKTILAGSVPDVDKLEVPALVKETIKAIDITPDNLPQTHRSKEAMKRIIGGLSSLTHGLGELRHEYGTGHGKDGSTIAPDPVFAKLAVASSAAFASFMMELNEQQQAKGKGQQS